VNFHFGAEKWMFKKNAKTKIKNLKRKIEYDFVIQESNFATIIEKATSNHDARLLLDTLTFSKII
jgi:hypothetical protein